MTIRHLKTGKLTRSVKLSDDVGGSLCTSHSGSPTAWLNLMDRTQVSVDLMRGTFESAPKPPSYCNRKTSGARVVPAPETVDGLRGQWAIESGSLRVVLADKAAGTPTPTLIGIDVNNNQVRWRSAVLPNAPTHALVSPNPSIADMDETRVYLGYYHRKNNESWMLALDAAYGQEVWRRSLRYAGNAVKSIVVKQRIYVVVADEKLVVMEATTGNVVASLGG